MTDRLPLELPPYEIAFLLSTLGFRVHTLWAERLVPLGLDARQAAMILHVAAAEGQPQQALAQALQIPPSRVVALVDTLERRGLLRRQGNPADRRVRTLHLTAEGRQMIGTLTEVSARHEHDLCVGLDTQERQHLLLLLKKVAADLDLSDTVHSGLGDGEWQQP